MDMTFERIFNCSILTQISCIFSLKLLWKFTYLIDQRQRNRRIIQPKFKNVLCIVSLFIGRVWAIRVWMMALVLPLYLRAQKVLLCFAVMCAETWSQAPFFFVESCHLTIGDCTLWSGSVIFCKSPPGPPHPETQSPNLFLNGRDNFSHFSF